jgi:hypothetical protein
MTDAAETRKQSILKPFARRRKGELEAIAAEELAADPAASKAPRSPSQMRAELIEACREADAAMIVLRGWLQRRRDLINEAVHAGVVGPVTARKAQHRLSIDRAFAAHGIDRYATGFRPAAAARLSCEAQARALLPSEREL